MLVLRGAFGAGLQLVSAASTRVMLYMHLRVVAMVAPPAVKTVVPIAKVTRYGSQCPGQSGSVEHTHQLAAA